MDEKDRRTVQNGQPDYGGNTYDRTKRPHGSNRHGRHGNSGGSGGSSGYRDFGAFGAPMKAAASQHAQSVQPVQTVQTAQTVHPNQPVQPMQAKDARTQSPQISQPAVPRAAYGQTEQTYDHVPVIDGETDSNTETAAAGNNERKETSKSGESGKIADIGKIIENPETVESGVIETAETAGADMTATAETSEAFVQAPTPEPTPEPIPEPTPAHASVQASAPISEPVLQPETEVMKVMQEQTADPYPYHEPEPVSVNETAADTDKPDAPYEPYEQVEPDESADVPGAELRNAPEPEQKSELKIESDGCGDVSDDVSDDVGESSVVTDSEAGANDVTDYSRRKHDFESTYAAIQYGDKIYYPGCEGYEEILQAALSAQSAQSDQPEPEQSGQEAQMEHPEYPEQSEQSEQSVQNGSAEYVSDSDDADADAEKESGSEAESDTKGNSESGSDDMIQQRFEGTGEARDESSRELVPEPADAVLTEISGIWGNDNAGKTVDYPEDFSVNEANGRITYVADIPEGDAGNGSEAADSTETESGDSVNSAAETEAEKPKHPLFEDKYGIQERFDITFLDDEITESTRSHKNDIVYEDDNDTETEEYSYRGYSYDGDGADDSMAGYPEESELSEEKDKDEFVGFEELGGSGSDTPEETEVPSETDELLENNNDIWDDDNREVWSEHDRFMALCRSLSVPPLKISKRERRPASQNGTEKVKSSGYRYEMVERLPFDEGLRVEDRDSYTKREKTFCEDRAEKHGRALRDKQRRRGVKTWAAGIAVLLCLVLDCLNFVSTDGVRVINAESIMILAGAEIVLALIGAIIVFDCMIDGLKCAARGMFIPELFTLLAAVMTIIYHGSLMLLTPLPDNAILLGSPALAVMFVTALYRYYLIKREVKAFEVTSSYGSYCTEVRMSNFRSTPECAEFEGYAERESTLYKLNRVSRIDGCYNEQPLRDECFGMIRVLFLCVICASLVAGIVFGLIGQSVYNGLLSAFSLVLFASPVSVFVSMFLPRFRAAEHAAEDGSAIIGFDEESEEFDENVIMIDEDDLYPAENVTTKIEVCNLPGIEGNVLRAAALFHKLGGTLGHMFGGAEPDETEKVELLEITENGITANVGKSQLRAGTDKYLKKFGIKVARYDGELDRNSRVLYVADDGEFFCRIIMNFRPDEELCRRISDLRTSDTLISLKSCNPCIDSTLVFYTTGLEPELLKNIKYSAGDDVSPAETDREGTLVSHSGAVGFFTALIEYKRQKKLVFFGSRLAGFTCAAGAAAALIISALRGGGAAVPLLALACQAVFCGIAAVVGSRSVSCNAVKVKKK